MQDIDDHRINNDSDNDYSLDQMEVTGTCYDPSVAMVHTDGYERPFLNIVNRGGRPENSPSAKMRWRGGCGNLQGGI